MGKIAKRWLPAVVLTVSVLAVIAVWSSPQTYRIGIDGVLFEKKIPFYAKVGGFLYRDWMYRDIVSQVTAGKRGAAEKSMALLSYVNENVSSDIPSDYKIYDDHPLNILIRRYGVSDQKEDIFTILCSYAGLKAGRAICYSPDNKNSMIFSFVLDGDRWLIFSATDNKYFCNKEGRVASVGDLRAGDLLFSQEEAPYRECLKGVGEVDFSSFLHYERAAEQMPFGRIRAIVKKVFSR